MQSLYFILYYFLNKFIIRIHNTRNLCTSQYMYSYLGIYINYVLKLYIEIAYIVNLAYTNLWEVYPVQKQIEVI